MMIRGSFLRVLILVLDMLLKFVVLMMIEDVMFLGRMLRFLGIILIFFVMVLVVLGWLFVSM